jgi:hypothetical protein
MLGQESELSEVRVLAGGMERKSAWGWKMSIVRNECKMLCEKFHKRSDRASNASQKLTRIALRPASCGGAIIRNSAATLQQQNRVFLRPPCAKESSTW